MNRIFLAKLFTLFISVLILVFCIGNICIANEKSTTIAITPFTIHAAKDMDYLRSGVQDMLESRIGQGEQVAVVSKMETAKAIEGFKEPINEKEAREIGSKLGANFVLIGSITLFGSSMSMDVKLVDVTQQKPTLAFFEQSETIDDLVPKINRLALDVNAGLLGPSEAFGATSGAITVKQAPADGLHAHPEKLAENVPASEKSPAADVNKTDDGTTVEFWKSRIYKLNIHGMSLGDVDGDGKIETVIITNNALIIFRNENNQVFKITEIKESRNHHFVGVDVADINGNGLAEIFISGLSPQRTGVSSSVYEYDAGNLKKMIENSPWLYRVVEGSEKDKKLLGQEFKPKKNLVVPIFSMKWVDGTYTPQDKVVSSHPFVLLGLAYGSLTAGSPEYVIAYNANDRIQILDESGEIQHDGYEQYGGSTLHYSKGRIGKEEIDQSFLPMRILLTDIDHDGGNEIVVVKNFDMIRRVFNNTRIFTAGQVEIFSWDGLVLNSNWKSPKIAGRGIRDIAWGDFNNDGYNQLVAVILLKEGDFVGTTPKSRLIAFQLK